MPLNTPASLLFYLAASGDWVSRSELAYLYRPDDAESEALAYLRLQVHRAQGLPWAEGLEVEASRLRWQVDTDLAALHSARQARRWREVINLYGGPLLGKWELRDKPTYNAWLDLEREGAQQAYASALREEAGRWERAADYQQAAGLYERLAAIDEFDEAAVMDQVRTLALTGEVDLALRRHKVFAALLEDELGSEPSPEFEALVGEIRDGKLRALSDGGAAARTKPDATPQPATRFVGRHAELAELTELVERSDCRLLTVVGIGGSGKTRLVLELRRALAGHFEDGARYVSLEAAASAQQAIARIAHALSVETDVQQDLADALVEHLSERESLLVLDNLEQLSDLAPFIARALTSAPGLRIVAASRVALQLNGEWLFDLGGLDLPQATTAVTEDGSAAVELFVSAARRVAPLKTFDTDELDAVARICRHVDGLPLALELAAAWVRAVPVARIAEEIASDLDLLSSDAVDLPERHRSIAALLDRTWTDLSEAKRDALMRLSVFRGGSSLEASEAVTGARLPILLSLVNQSLISRSAAGRLASHPLVLQYAYRRLSADPVRLHAALDSHADYYRAVLERYDPGRQAERVRERRKRDRQAGTASAEPGESSGYSWRELEPDSANLEQAWFRLLETGKHESMAAAADSLMAYYNTLGFYQRGTFVAEQTVEALTEEGPRSEVNLRCIVMLALANMGRERGLLQDALRHSQAALQLAQRRGLNEHTSMAMRYLGDARQMLGQYDEARSAYEGAIAIQELLGNEQELGNVLNSLASMHAMREEFTEATAGFIRCVELFESSGDELSMAIAHNNLGYLADAQGDAAGASGHYEKSLVAFERIQFTRGISAVKNNLVVLYGALGRLDEAERMGLESLAMKEKSNDRLGLIITLKNLADIRLLQDRLPDAFDLLERALSMAAEIDAVPRLLQVLPSYADALMKAGRNVEAERVLSALVSHSLATPSQLNRATSLCASLEARGDEPDDSRLTGLLPDLPFKR